MEKLNYTKELMTDTNEQVSVGTYDKDSDIYITLIDDEDACAIVTLTRKEAQRVKRYLEDAITTHIMNWEEEN